MTCSALKPQGLGPDDLGKLAFELAMGGLDFIKDDHGLANRSYSPFADRTRACAAAVRPQSERARPSDALHGEPVGMPPSICSASWISHAKRDWTPR